MTEKSGLEGQFLVMHVAKHAGVEDISKLGEKTEKLEADIEKFKEHLLTKEYQIQDLNEYIRKHVKHGLDALWDTWLNSQKDLDMPIETIRATSEEIEFDIHNMRYTLKMV